MTRIDEAKGFLGKRVRVKLDDFVLVEGKFLTFSDSGEFTILMDDGFVHYCWPWLEIESAE